ncbi:MAG TPA: sigma-54 dependent transcriptional regulator [Candidatus Dormibacteraeota bacterium]|nr:sigma-54 dependent transcriptional regulator [Candidatus Dormibacteraeota bacterium]
MESTSPGTILVADDEDSVRFVLVKALESDGHVVLQASGGREALDRLRERPLDLAFVDLRMPDYDGLAVLAAARESGLTTPIVIITAQNTMDNAIEAMKRGAYDYIAKPFNIDEVQAVAHRALEMARMSTDLKRVERELRGRFEVGVAIIGNSPAMQEIYKIIGRIANTDTTVLIQGESGTGKELIAKVIHYHSPRWSGPFVAINCSAIPRELLESELFGHEKGAFTGATEQRPGKFELAQGGTILLDEIADMPLERQAKLLRVLQEREVTRLGGRETLKVDCRILAATNQSLERAAKQGRFREDLFFRLNVVPVQVPPLRDRRGDIPELLTFFIDKINREMGTSITGISPEARDALLRHNWPGNVRELENTLIRAAVLASGSTIMPRDLALAVQEPTPAMYGDMSLEEIVRLKLREYFRQTGDVEPSDLYALILERVERPLIELTLERTGGNQLQAAAILGINRNTLRKKISTLKITPRRGTAQE